MCIRDRTSGALTMVTDIAVPANLLWANLKWYNFANGEGLAPYDQWVVEISTDSGANWAVLYDGASADAPAWAELSADLSAVSYTHLPLSPSDPGEFPGGDV